ncbi:MAG: IS982 family transposase [Parcubacteria group bacterium]|nr:IS982 family transposase [Parcubacteria group bacterium]
MLSLQAHHIIGLYVWVDDNLPKVSKPLGGRPTLLSDSELITILAWNVLAVKQKTLKDIHKWVELYHQNDFPRLPKYSAFVDHCHRMIPQLVYLLEHSLAKQAKIRFMDSTMVPVCKLVRANRHKVAKAIARFGKNHQGWHYGLKLHASTDYQGRFCGLTLTPANMHDAQQIPYLVNKHTKVAVGDGGYTARVMRERVWKEYGTIIISPPHFKQKTKLMAGWQYLLLRTRPKIEATFDYLKEHLSLVTSFPRSVKGYLFHYLKVLLGYQIMAS